MAADKEHVVLDVGGRELRVSSPSKLFFPERGLTKLDLVNYYLECEQAVVRHLRERPTVMKRWVDGVQGEPFFQKRVPHSAPDWIETATVTFPSGRSARELVPNDAAHLVWGTNLGVIDWNPWPVRRRDLDRPDELRVDLDPTPGVPFDVAFLDPPFGKDALVEYIPLLDAGNWLNVGGLVYLENERAAGAPALPDHWEMLKSKWAGEVGYHLARVNGRK